MNMFARFDENPAMTIQDNKETKHYRRMHTQLENSIPTKTLYPPQTKFAGGIMNVFQIIWKNLNAKCPKKQALSNSVDQRVLQGMHCLV